MYRPYSSSTADPRPFLDVQSLIRNLAQDFVTNFNTGNYAQDGAFMAPHHDPAYGPKAVERLLREFGEAGYEELRLETTRVESSGDMAMEIGPYPATIPHKQKIIRYLDGVEPLARRIGAVNTVWRKAGKWRGTNTDAAGVTGPLARLLKIANSSVLIVGNGGAARSAACALSDAGARITLVGRNADRVRALGKICGAESLLKEQLDAHHFDAVIHATPLGMFPHVNECFFEDRIPADIVFDMVYNPLET